MNIDILFNNLWQQYITLAPNANKIKKLFENTQNGNIINDHIALRTLNNSICNIDVVSKVFIELGYEKKDYYGFDSKKLDAYYFKHENDEYPKVFISELKVELFTKDIQDILNNIVELMPKKLLTSSSLVYSHRHWDISYKTYKYLYEQSEYAAWFYVFGYTANHFTISINHLENFNTIQEVNKFVKDNGYILNTSGGEIKGSVKDLLEQSSTMAQNIKIEFTDGIYEIPSCFYEFAKRYKDKDNNTYQGFVAKSADLIFESTN